MEAAERWKRVEEIFAATLDCAPSHRSQFLDQACANDAALRAEIASLLAYEGREKEIDAIVADVNAGRGTIGKLLKDEAVYNEARTAIARFNTTTARIDNVVAGAQRGEGTLGKLITDEQLYNNVNNLSSEGVKLIYDFRQNPKKYLTIKFQLF